jgi:hypothetical protein
MVLMRNNPRASESKFFSDMMRVKLMVPREFGLCTHKFQLLTHSSFER